MIISIMLVYKAIKFKAIVDDIYFYSKYFEGDIDGYVYTSDMVDIIGKNEERINKEIKEVLRKKYMKNFVITNKWPKSTNSTCK